jgi:hypothetical protein
MRRPLDAFYPRRVGLVLLCCSSWGDGHCSKYCIIVQFHHEFSSLARQACPAALPGSSTNFDRIWCTRSLAPQSPHCNTLAGHQNACARCCPDRFKPGPWQCVLFLIPRSFHDGGAVNYSTSWKDNTNFQRLSFVYWNQKYWALAKPYYIAKPWFKLVFSPISPCFHFLHARADVQQTGLNLFSCSYVDLFRSLLQVFYANAGKDWSDFQSCLIQA